MAKSFVRSVAKDGQIGEWFVCDGQKTSFVLSHNSCDNNIIGNNAKGNRQTYFPIPILKLIIILFIVWAGLV